MGQLRILIVDDQALIRDALKSILELEPGFTVVGTARDGSEAAELATRLQPDVVLMDIRMPVMDGVAATRLIKGLCRETHVIILTTYEQDEYVFDALGAGAAGYLLKDMPVEDLVQAIRGTVEGGTFINPSVASRLVAELTRLKQDRAVIGGAGVPGSGAAGSQVSGPGVPGDRVPGQVEDNAGIDKVMEGPNGLSAREVEILTLVARGLNNREIAKQLFLTEGTVKNYISGIYSKLQTHDRVQAAMYAREHGLTAHQHGKDGSSDDDETA